MFDRFEPPAIIVKVCPETYLSIQTEARISAELQFKVTTSGKNILM